MPRTYEKEMWMPVSDLRFAESKHRYTVPGTGERVVSVTSIVGNWDDGDKLGAGAGAAVKLTKAGIDYRAEWNSKRDLGTRLHGYASLWANGKTADVFESDEAHLNGFIAFCEAKRPEWLWSERAVISRAGWGGRIDMIGYWDGLYHLVDLKSGRCWKRELGLQMAGYASTDGFIVYDESGMSVDIEPLPHIDVWEGLYLGGDGKATLVEVPELRDGQTRLEAQAEAKEAFRHLFEVRRWADKQPKA